MFRFSNTVLWLLLLAATAVTYALGEAGLVGGVGLWPILVIFGFAWFKGLGIILVFMELRHAPALWRNILIGWLTCVISLILLAYWLGRH